ncbi:alpha-L-fucosidase [Promicromonospora sp. NPDC057488]|uniref:alpha-L-fucosidase n=1 Tax=Promicromonospora sp. NPDC057488 TaxID=3346147 RepID=UPI00366A7909
MSRSGSSFGHNQIEDAELTLSARSLAMLYADVVARGGRLLLNVGPTASGLIPEPQRRTLEGFGPWIREVKPWTGSRRPLTSDELTVDAPEDVWWRAWRSGGRIVVITDQPAVSFSGPAADDLVVLPLPAP